MYLSNFVRYIYNEDFGGWDIVGPPSQPFIPSPGLLDPDSVLDGNTINNSATSVFDSFSSIYNSIDIHTAASFVQNLYSVYLFPTVVSILVTLSLGFLVIKAFLGRDQYAKYDFICYSKPWSACQQLDPGYCCARYGMAPAAHPSHRRPDSHASWH